MKDALLLSLGHGSSAVLINDGKIINGYQNERISKIKGDSQFPINAIEEIRYFDDIPNDIDIMISHWEPFGQLEKLSNKHYNSQYIEKEFSKSDIYSMSPRFTHHDAHAYSALAYNPNPSDHHIIVADGFGNFGEVLSIYQMVSGIPKLIFRSHGYMGSIGLLYQYATDFVGMKMNQDEWKLNAKASNIPSEDIHRCNKLGKEIYDNIICKQQLSCLESYDDPIYSLGALSFVHREIHDFLSNHFTPYDLEQIAYTLQVAIEKIIDNWIRYFKIKNVTLVGGCFMNVQLNGHILNHLVGDICIMPLSGDCGAPLGIYKNLNPEFYIPDNLCWGKRRVEKRVNIDRIIYTSNIAREILNYLSMDYIVNVVRDKSEFGERAYCNTSTLALPVLENSKYINKLNNRDTDMPMCPVVTINQYKELFKDTDRVIRSGKHMIIALEYIALDEYMLGISHKSHEGILTGRPQVVSKNHYMNPILEKLGPLINTSFNNHGNPICQDMGDVVRTHNAMLDRDSEMRLVTLIEEIK